MHLSNRHSTHSILKFVFVLRQLKKLSGSKWPAAVLHHFPTTQAEPGLPIFAHGPFTGAASSRFDLAPRFISQSPWWNLVHIDKLNENSQHVPTSITCDHCWWLIEFLWSSSWRGWIGTVKLDNFGQHSVSQFANSSRRLQWRILRNRERAIVSCLKYIKFII